MYQTREGAWNWLQRYSVKFYSIAKICMHYSQIKLNRIVVHATCTVVGSFRTFLTCTLSPFGLFVTICYRNNIHIVLTFSWKSLIMDELNIVDDTKGYCEKLRYGGVWNVFKSMTGTKPCLMYIECFYKEEVKKNNTSHTLKLYRAAFRFDCE